LQGAAQTLDEAADPRFLSSKNRPAVAQAFTHRASGEAFLVVNNHLKSKGSSCTGVGDRDQGDGQGNCSGVRTDAARALIDWLPATFGAELASRALVTGDLNAYRMEDPVRVLLEAGYADLLPADAHTYVFFGRAGRLDHALAAPGLAPHAKAAVWHVNSDEARLLDYNEEYDPPAYKQPGPYRSSDHDPILTVLTFN
jgi:predicted extracellular nuclease